MTHCPRKRFGQHFVRDAGVIARMVSAIRPRRGDVMVEIGGGDGALTCPLLAACGALVVLEIDRDLTPLLKERCGPLGRLTVRQADALRFDFSTLGAAGRLRVAGNLPYNIATPLLFRLAAAAGRLRDAHVLLQREVAERIAAEPGGRAYGRLSVMLQWVFAATPLFEVAPAAFEPRPKVHSTFMRLCPHAAPPAEVPSPRALATVVGAAFGGRRKKLRNSLRRIVDAAGFIAADIDPARRAETLSLPEFAALARVAAVDVVESAAQ